MRYAVFNADGFLIAGPYPPYDFGLAKRDAYHLQGYLYDFWARRAVIDYCPKLRTEYRV